MEKSATDGLVPDVRGVSGERGARPTLTISSVPPSLACYFSPRPLTEGVFLETTRVADIEQQLAVTQQLTHLGSWHWDVATGRLTCSDELYRMLGFAPRSFALSVDFVMSRLHADDRAGAERYVAEAVERGEPFRSLLRFLRTDGTIRELDTIGEAVRERGDATSRVAALMGTCRDVTEEREQSRQLLLYADIVRNVQIALSVWAPGERAARDCFSLVAFNPAAEKITQFPLTPFIGKSLLEIVPFAAGGTLESLLTRVAREGCAVEASTVRTKNPANPARALSIKGFPLPSGCVGIAMEDVTAQTVDLRLQSAEQSVLEMIASEAPLSESLAALVRAIEQRLPPAIGSVLLIDPDGLHVRHGAAPNLPEAFRRAIDGAAIGPRAGSCGTAAYLKRPVFVADIESDPLWEDYRETALAHGLRACWAIPILTTDQRVLGTFAFYYRAVRTPAATELEITARAARLAGIAIERKQLEVQLRELSAHTESALEEERTGIAREIHDELGQSLTAIKMDIAWIGRRLSSAASVVDRTALLEKLETMSAMTDEVIQQVRRISAELRPGVLDDLGLVAAIEWQAQDFEERTGTTCVVRSSAGDVKVDRRVATAAFRIFQEALTNVTRHARAQRVEVTIEVSDGTLLLDIHDDGAGITPEAARSPKSLGILGARERAHRFGGSVTVERAEPRGTLVALRVPLAKGAP